MKGLLVGKRWLGHTATEGERAELHTCERVRKGPPIKRRTLPTGLERQGTRNVKDYLHEQHRRIVSYQD